MTEKFLVKFENGKYLRTDSDEYVSQKRAERFEDRYEAWEAAINAYHASFGSDRPQVVRLIPKENDGD